MAEAVTEPAQAKINPFLRVLGRREDGYHEIETLVLPITLADGVQAVPAEDLRLTVVGELAGEVPTGEPNLVLKAADALRKWVGESRGAHLLLSKRIPVSAGLGGGSADAAAALRALDRLWSCGLGIEGLAEFAAEIGSDVPALLHDGPVVARGRGELVDRVELPRTWWVLCTVEQGISAAEAYAWYDEKAGKSNFGVDQLLALFAKGDAQSAGRILSNDLERPVVDQRPDVNDAKERLTMAGALGAVMSGSGPTVVGLARDGVHAEELAGLVAGVAVASMGRD